jgi:hypothetical protein
VLAATGYLSGGSDLSTTQLDARSREHLGLLDRYWYLNALVRYHVR